MAQSIPVRHPNLEDQFVEDEIPGASSGLGAVVWIVIGLLIMTGIFALVLVSIPHIAG